MDSLRDHAKDAITRLYQTDTVLSRSESRKGGKARPDWGRVPRWRLLLYPIFFVSGWICDCTLTGRPQI